MKTVPEAAAVTMEVETEFMHLCPHVDEVDQGRVKLRWRTAGATFELHALREFLRSFAETRISHEALTELIQVVLEKVDGVEDVKVDTCWTTAGMEIRCTSGGTQ